MWAGIKTTIPKNDSQPYFPKLRTPTTQTRFEETQRPLYLHFFFPMNHIHVLIPAILQ